MYKNKAYFNKKYKLNNRISDAYPETTNQNQKYIAHSHQILDQLDLSQIDKQDFYFRTKVYDFDLEEIKLLHQEWFPIPYHQQFFNSLTNPESMINTILIELDISKFIQDLNLDFISDMGYYQYVNQKQRFIVGMIVYNYRDVKYQYMRYSFKDLFQDNTMTLYIMTIGVVNELRVFGLGTQLLDKVKYIASQNQLVKYIYLHMVTYNESGSNFYKKNGFKIVDFMEGHYEIEGMDKDAYIFTYYVNGSQPPREFKEILSNIIGFVNFPKHIYKLFCKQKNSQRVQQERGNIQKLLAQRDEEETSNNNMQPQQN